MQNTMTKEYTTKDSGDRSEYKSGMVRDTDVGKRRYDLIPRLMLSRIAELMQRGAEKYSEHNWSLASSKEELLRFKSSALRHMFQWMDGERDEDHAAAVIVNVMFYEEVLSRIAGSTDLFYDFRDPRLPERFWSKVDIDEETGCWFWTAALFEKGYGAFSWESKTRSAHSVCWEAYNGPVESGLELDHLCRRPACVSPYHLEPVTHEENIRRGKAYGKGLCQKGHRKNDGERCLTCSRKTSGWKGGLPFGERSECPSGHEYNDENTWIEPSTGRRRCRICKLKTQAKNRDKKRKKAEIDDPW